MDGHLENPELKQIFLWLSLTHFLLILANTSSLLFLTLFLLHMIHIFEFFITLKCSVLFFFSFLFILLTETGLATVFTCTELAVWASLAWNSRFYSLSLLSADLQVHHQPWLPSCFSLPCSFRNLWHQVPNHIDSLLLLEWFRFLAFSFLFFSTCINHVKQLLPSVSHFTYHTLIMFTP